MTDLLHRAAKLAVQAHHGQERKSSPLPYVSHCFDVLKRLSCWGITDRNLLAAALLHDTVEDTRTSLEDVHEQFGAAVASIVEQVTWPADVRGAARKFDHLAEFAIAEDCHPERKMHALLLKAADRVCNVRDYWGHSDTREYAARYALLAYPVFRAFAAVGKMRVWEPLWGNAHLQDDLGWLVSMIKEVPQWLPIDWADDPWRSPVEEIRDLLFPSGKGN